MRFRLLSVLLSVSAALAQTSVDSYLAIESPIAKTGLIANIGPSGSKSQGAKAGVVIASPSSSNPDYLFQWTRDSALVFAAIVNQSVTTPGQNVWILITLGNLTESPLAATHR